MSKPISRRDFVRTAAAATSYLALDAPGLTAQSTRKRRYAIVGTGDRATGMWGRPVVADYADVLEFVGLSDPNPKRCAASREMMGVSCPTFTSFDEMCDRTKPDLLTVTTVDAFHAEHIVKALDRGIDVITEKPMVIDSAQCRAVLDAEKRNNRKIVVTFNYRYAPKHRTIKEILMAGEIGRVISVDFHWYLDVYHGADYFRRWHRLKNRSGSLWVHKATHHFDLINWWLAADPVEVAAQARLGVYGKNGAFRGVNCRTCPHKSQCQFYYDVMTNPTRVKLYVNAEDVDGYHRDGCVFKEDIDIYDSMSAVVSYSNGATMTYSVNAFMPFEGYRLAFNGEKGRLEIRDYERQPWEQTEETEIQLTKNFGKMQKVPIKQETTGGHGGGDTRLRDLIFRKSDAPEHMKLPDSRAGAMSCLTGIAARTSVEEKRLVKISELVSI
jgi:predicted dehydrogenase